MTSPPSKPRSPTGRRWDVVIDNTASMPRWVTESAGLLAEDATDWYLYTSSISAYADSSTPGADETAPVGPDPPRTRPRS